MEQSPAGIHPSLKVDSVPTSKPVSQATDKGLSTDTTEASYIPIDHVKPLEDEELPRKLPKKATLPTDTAPLNVHRDDNPWDFTPPPEEQKQTTILERPLASRSTAKNLFNKSFQPKVFSQIHTLRSHLSPVRALISCFSASTLQDETCFVSAGDDATIKFWRVSKGGIQGKKKGNFDILPQITYRGHTGIITCLTESNEQIWSGGTDGGIRAWKVPPPNRDAYGSSGS
jgi:WD40 repeat protein